MEAFIEEQKFIKSWWFIIIPGIVFALLPVGFAIQNQESVEPDLLLGLGTVLLVALIFFFLGLNTRVDDAGVAFSFGFFKRKQKTYHWADIKQARVTQYNPLFEYGGWGYKKGWRAKKRAYSVYGNMGLEVTFFDESKIMIGTREPQKLQEHLNYLKGKYNIAAIA
jgi:hypothetical protein